MAVVRGVRRTFRNEPELVDDLVRHHEDESVVTPEACRLEIGVAEAILRDEGNRERVPSRVPEAADLRCRQRSVVVDGIQFLPAIETAACEVSGECFRASCLVLLVRPGQSEARDIRGMPVRVDSQGWDAAWLIDPGRDQEDGVGKRAVDVTMVVELAAPGGTGVQEVVLRPADATRPILGGAGEEVRSPAPAATGKSCNERDGCSEV